MTKLSKNSFHRKILVVDDDQLFRESLTGFLSESYDVDTAESGEDAVRKIKATIFDLVLLDITLPEKDGIEILREIKSLRSGLPVIMLTAIDKIPTVVECIKLGAEDYATKPPDADQLVLTIERVLETSALRQELTHRRKLQAEEFRSHSIVGGGNHSHQLKENIRLYAAVTAPVLIIGETGTGKELAARAIHEQSPRKEKPFVAINCAAIPKDLIESELFGYEKGAYTGATGSGIGKLELANGGTLVLDEIGDLRMDAQAKLLRALESQEFYRVGGNSLVAVNVRIVASTNKDLRKFVENGLFREDLYFRLNVCQIRIPPLRERKEDIPDLLRYYMGVLTAKLGKQFDHVADDAMAILCDHSWPGNVRELRNLVERIMIVHSGPVILKDHVLPVLEVSPRSTTTPASVEISTTGLDEQVHEYEKVIIEKALEMAKGNKSEAARLLKLSPHTFYYRLEKHNLS